MKSQSIRGRPEPEARAGRAGLGPEYVGLGRASGLSTSGRKVLIASGLVGPGLPFTCEFRLIYIYIIKTQLLCVCVFVCPDCIKEMEE